ncbi:MAG: hypothetical protein M3144_09800 [Actinomycetota bacterium]|nr:hypothetical protein [Actinomycetota bacterium]
MAGRKRTDEVLDALDALLVVLHESSERNAVAARRARTIRRLRSHGRSYREILRRVEGALDLGVTRESVEGLLHATDRLHAAEARALHEEGVSIEEIASLSGATTPWNAEVLRARTQQDRTSR